MLGWWVVGLLSMLISLPAWALDLDQTIQQKDSDAQQILQTLGQGKKPDSQTTYKTKKKVYVILLKKHAKKA